MLQLTAVNLGRTVLFHQGCGKEAYSPACFAQGRGCYKLVHQPTAVLWDRSNGALIHHKGTDCFQMLPSE